HNIKDYKLGRVTKIKGISKTSRKVSADTYITYNQVGIRQALHKGTLEGMTWRKVTKHLKRLYEKGIRSSEGDIQPLIMLYSVDDNWLDFKAMVERYGETALYRDKWLDSYLGSSFTTDNAFIGVKEDLRPVDRMAIAYERQLARHNGEMIYQRGRGIRQ
ncbi:unnamed protein product, partial [marine sediment metagenome]